MASYDALIFQQELFDDEVKKICDKALDDAAEFIMNGEWKASKVKEGADGQWDKAIDLQFDDLRVWVAEYGAGRYADTKRNPYWGDYLASGLTSAQRSSGGRVVKRGNTEYSTFDIESGEIVLRTGGKPAGGYIPDGFQEHIDTVPDPFLEDLLDQAFRVFEDSFDRQFGQLDMSRFIFKEERQV